VTEIRNDIEVAKTKLSEPEARVLEVEDLSWTTR
jgi:hypothetical protein